ncbi:MAG TPA: YraN family protein [Bacteroidota bacterium]|nr:YraN family protein [Bacteroidota bacterium]
MKGPGTKVAGDEGELLAMQELKRLGYSIVEMKYRFGHGEIDIIARDGDVLVFCEVKTRKNDEFGPPEYALTKKKQAQIRKVATGYLYEHEIKEQECRFDVVAIRMWGGRTEINYIKNAF